MNQSELFSPLTLGAIELSNRIAMAPMTRIRSGPAGMPGEVVVEYYRQRAGTGLIITEGVYPAPESQSELGQPGITTDEQAKAWARVAEAVHAEGGRIVLQLMHGGRVSHPAVNGGRRVLAPSAIAVGEEVHTAEGKVPYALPEAMSPADINEAIAQHVAAARRAVDEGFDGVEVHGANGYLLHEFLSPNTNERSDDYGGSAENRARLAVEVVSAVASEVGAERVGLRISPQHETKGIVEADAEDVLATYTSLLERVRPLGLAYLSVLHAEPCGSLASSLAATFAGPIIANRGFASVSSVEEATELHDAPHIDAVAVGRPLIANPDLVARWRAGHAENPPRPELSMARVQRATRIIPSTRSRARRCDGSRRAW